MATSIKAPQRLLSLDVFRGFTVASMILVNNPGDWGHIYAPLEHSDWNGCTPTDLIFPFFLFIVGVSIVFALESKRQNKEQQKTLILKTSKRALILFGLGIAFSLFPFFDFSSFRIPGVLQRIAVVYFICAILFIKTNKKTLFAVFVGILVAYFIAMTFIPVPGVGAANLGKETNLAAWFDRLIFTEAHTWKLSITWDPEGFLSTFPAICSGLFGIFMGLILKSKDKNDAHKVAWLFSYGMIAAILGLIWDLFFPINKSLWTSSYVLYTGGVASMGMALCYWLIDVQGYKKFTRPFVIYGVNAITVYFISSVIARSFNLIKVPLHGNVVSLKDWFYLQFFVPHFSSAYNASLAGAITFVLIWYVILWMMYKKNIIIKV